MYGHCQRITNRELRNHLTTALSHTIVWRVIPMPDPVSSDIKFQKAQNTIVFFFNWKRARAALSLILRRAILALRPSYCLTIMLVLERRGCRDSLSSSRGYCAGATPLYTSASGIRILYLVRKCQKNQMQTKFMNINRLFTVKNKTN